MAFNRSLIMFIHRVAEKQLTPHPHPILNVFTFLHSRIFIWFMAIYFSDWGYLFLIKIISKFDSGGMG